MQASDPGLLGSAIARKPLRRPAFRLRLVALITVCGIALRGEVCPQASAQEPLTAQSDGVQSKDNPVTEARAIELSSKVLEFINESDLRSARDSQRELVSVLEMIAGPKHWQTVDQKTSLTELERVLQFTEQEQKTYLVAYRRMVDGIQTASLENYGKAEEQLGQALKGLTGLLGDNSASVACTLEQLGIARMMQERPADAKEPFLRAVAARRAITGEDNPSYINAIKLVGNAFFEEKDFDQAETFFRDAAKKNRKAFGTRSLQYADSLGNLSRALVGQQRFIEAEALSVQAITIAQAYRYHPALMAGWLNNLADVDIAYGEYHDAESNLQRALTLYEKSLPPWSPVIAKVLDRYSGVLLELKRTDEAQAMKERADAIRRQYLSSAAK